MEIHISLLNRRDDPFIPEHDYFVRDYDGYPVRVSHGSLARQYFHLRGDHKCFLGKDQSTPARGRTISRRDISPPRMHVLRP